MGYCSYVALCLSPTAEAAFQKEYGAASRTPESDLPPDSENLLNHPDRHYEKQGASLRIWEAVKWYRDDFPELRFLHSFIDEQPCEDCLFLRYGEDLDDIEKDGGYYDNPFKVRISRSFTFEVPPSVSIKPTHLILCLSPKGEKLFSAVCNETLAAVGESLETAWMRIVTASPVCVSDKKSARCYSLKGSLFSAWLDRLLDTFTSRADAADYYIIRTGKGPERSVETGLLFDVPQGASLFEANHNVGPFLRFLMN
jgi:hypothetical protein